MYKIEPTFGNQTDINLRNLFFINLPKGQKKCQLFADFTLIEEITKYNPKILFGITVHS